MAPREATCTCGQLRLTADGEPTRIGICHCLACQRRTGSAFGLHVRYRHEDVETAGLAKQYTRLSDDGDTRTISFCPECSDVVWLVCGGEPELVGVPVGAFADPSFPPPTYEVYESRRHPWLGLPDDLARRTE
jgi:hypothetical protein